MMLGERIPATRLHQLGVVNRLTPPGSALSEALALAQRLNARAPNALASIKELTHQAATSTLDEAWQAECHHFVENLHHPNGGIGIEAFLQKQKATYKP